MEAQLERWPDSLAEQVDRMVAESDKLAHAILHKIAALAVAREVDISPQPT